MLTIQDAIAWHVKQQKMCLAIVNDYPRIRDAAIRERANQAATFHGASVVGLSQLSRSQTIQNNGGLSQQKGPADGTNVTK